jgi:8-oxo-dGTP pyrophosphatase MutT (NUDIX family)
MTNAASGGVTVAPAENPFALADDEPRFAVIRPKDAASLILLREDGRTTRVLMGERHQTHVFLPGRFVFPGGRLEPADMRLALATDLRPEVGAKVAAGTSPARAKGLALASIRETFEETGLLVGERSPARPQTRSRAWGRFFVHGVIPRLEKLDFVARAITPPGRPRRFDARFFMAKAEDIAHRLDAAESTGELLRPVWLTLDEARAADILPITRCIINEVEARLAVGPDSGRPVPFFVPRRGKAVILSL